jgi:riboflavin synthase
MFTGIIESTGAVLGIHQSGTNYTFTVQSPLASELKVDQSLAHNGVCLTVVSIDTASGTHQVTAISETLSKTNLGQLQVGSVLNLERCLVVGARLDGHFVQGHVDGTATVTRILDQEGSWEITLQIDPAYGHLVVEKGSICLNGISLTVFGLGPDTIKVAIIPYTWEHTDIHSWHVGSKVNIEFDILGKYLDRWKVLAGPSPIMADLN